MLILTRKIGEAIAIGDQARIEVRVLDINRRQVKIGINAPMEISIHREEIYKRIQNGRGLIAKVHEKKE